VSRPRLDSDEQRAILDGLRKGRRIRPVIVRRGTNRRVRFGFSDTEPVHANAIDGLLFRGLIAIRDGEIEQT
jgi:hypothetical protein